MERKKWSGRGWESCYVKKFYGTFGVEMRAYRQKLVQFCKHTHHRYRFQNIIGSTCYGEKPVNVALNYAVVFTSKQYLTCESVYLIKVNWIHRTTSGSIGQESGTIISVDNKIDIDDSLNRVQDGNHKYDIVVTAHGETRTYMLITRRLELKDAGTYTCKVLIQGQPESTHPSKDGKMVVLCEYVVTACVHSIACNDYFVLHVIMSMFCPGLIILSIMQICLF